MIQKKISHCFVQTFKQFENIHMTAPLIRAVYFISGFVSWALLILAVCNTVTQRLPSETSVITCANYGSILISVYAVYFVCITLESLCLDQAGEIALYRACERFYHRFFIARIFVFAIQSGLEVFLLLMTGISAAIPASSDNDQTADAPFRVLKCFPVSHVWIHFGWMCSMLILNLGIIRIILTQYSITTGVLQVQNPAVPQLDQIVIQLHELHGQNGLSDAAIRSIPIIKIPVDQVDCAICLDNTPSSDQQGALVDVKQLRCDHNFHPQCIDSWLKIKNLCPKCRGVVLC